MNKKQPVSRFAKAKTKPRSAVQSWHNGADVEIHLYARSLQKAAKALVEKLERENARTDWDACPVVLLYREALELHLKALVGEGGNFLESRTDPLALAKTHSLRWLAQIVGQIIKAVKWESEFTCEGVASLAAFSALVNEVESLDPVARALRSSQPTGPGSAWEYYRTFNIAELAKRLDALLDLLDITADALAATWDQRAELSDEDKFHAEDTIKPTIH
jgi:hypothetical protein